jgi:hypothetical protein
MYCGDDRRFNASANAIYGSFIFITSNILLLPLLLSLLLVYVIEIFIRILADGPFEYFSKWHNM